jgi:hypothetical protein
VGATRVVPEECVAVMVEDLVCAAKSGVMHQTGKNYFKVLALLPPGSFMTYTFDYSLFRSVHDIV